MNVRFDEVLRVFPEAYMVAGQVICRIEKKHHVLGRMVRGVLFIEEPWAAHIRNGTFPVDNVAVAASDDIPAEPQKRRPGRPRKSAVAEE